MGQVRYIILGQETGKGSNSADPITGYEETLKFDSEKETVNYLQDDEELRAEY